MNALVRRLRRRLQNPDDAGFTLIYVLAITTAVAMLVGSTLVVSTASLVPAVQASYSQAADSAAQGGLQAFVAYADTYCPGANSAVSTCTLPSNYSGVTNITIPDSNGTYTASYSWLAQKDSSNRYFRVKSTGTVTQGGVTSTKVVIGDVIGGASLDDLDYGVITGFETQSSATVLSNAQRRTIALSSSAIDAADVPIKGNSITWSGASPGTAAGKVAVCNAKFDDKGGASNNPPPKAPNPYVDWTESGLSGNNYTNYQSCHTSWGSKTELLAAANASDGAGGYFSNDALLLSKSYPGGSGPLFNQPVTTGWHYTTADSGICSTASGQNYRSFNLLCAGYPVEVGGAPSSSSTYPDVQWQSQGPVIPSSAAPVVPSSACVYAGPTRVVLNGNSATVTSPQTTSTWVAANASTRPAQCYAGAGPSGMALATVDLTGISVLQTTDNGTVPSTTPATAHGSSGWPVTGQKRGDTASTSNSVFYLTNGTSGTSTATSWAVTATPGSYTPASGDNPSTKNDGAWVPQWTSYSGGSSCNSSTLLTDLRFANCFIPKGSYADSYSWLKAQVQAAIAASPSSYTTSAALQTLVNSFTSQGNSSDAASSAPTKTDYTSHRWNVAMTPGSANGCTQSTGVAGASNDTTLNAPSSDSFFANTNGNVHVANSIDTSCYTATVTLQIGTCNVALVAGICLNLGNYVWGNGTALLGGGKSVAQFSLTFTTKKTTTTTTTTAASSTFPSMSDVTQYQLGNSGTFGASGPGDLYVEGSAGHTMAVLANDDVIITGPLGPSGTNPSSPSTTAANPDTSTAAPTAALEIVARNNVRVYHPVKCSVTDASMIATTDAGWCPDDITGLYSSVLSDGHWPYQQYVNMRPDLAGLTIHAALFSLGNSDAHITCPQPPNGGGTCGGEFTVDNYNRATSLGYITEIGTIAMAHHAPVGEEWEVSDASGNTSRPYSGYQLAQQYQNVKALIKAAVDVSGLLHTTSTTSSLWHILSVSTAKPS